MTRNLPTQRSTLSLGLAAGCAAAIALPHDAPAHPGREQVPPALKAPAATLPGKGPAAFEAMLARWDRMPASAARDRLALEIDSVAGQRYATVSRLYWFTDLAAAQSAARTLERPILALRMLGRLDEDLSCANSRFFRTTLYANVEVSRLLREHFVLYWSSERPVPRVTIDYGDGRKIERTTTGNSAHYVLDAAGRVIDVLPGLYAPAVFQAELTKSARLAYRVRNLGDAQRAQALADHHRRELEASATRFQAAAGTQFMRGRARLLGRHELDASAVALAQRATMAKAIVEVPDLGKIGIHAGTVSPADLSAWAVIGQKLWGIYAPAGAPAEPAAGPAAEARPRRLPANAANAAGAAPAALAAPAVLDAQSRALVGRVHDAGPVKAAPAQLEAMLARLEQSIVADTALNELRLRPHIHGLLANPGAAMQSFEEINDWIYATVFHTPKSDAWLGLLPRTDFTGLPGDGVVMR